PACRRGGRGPPGGSRGSGRALRPRGRAPTPGNPATPWFRPDRDLLVSQDSWTSLRMTVGTDFPTARGKLLPGEHARVQQRGHPFCSGFTRLRKRHLAVDKDIVNVAVRQLKQIWNLFPKPLK